jgi:nucleotide-binding universal stress UspA family protein
MKRIVVGTNFSDAATEALTVAVRLAKFLGAAIDLVHVRPTPVAGSISPLPEVAPLPSPSREVVAEVQRRLDELAAGVRGAFVACLTFALEGDVADEIIDHAEHSDADLIVIGLHGGSARLHSLGRVVRRTVRRARCPLLVVPLREAAQDSPRPAG